MTDLVPLDDSGTTEALTSAMELATTIGATEFVPESYRRKSASIVAAVLTGRELGVPPMTALQKIHMIKGRPTLAAELMRSLVFKAGHHLEFPSLTDQKVTVRAWRADSEAEATEITWTMDMAKRAGLGGDNWRKYPRAMLTARATAEICRLVFPDCIGGLLSSEEAETLDDISEGAAPPPEPVAASRDHTDEPEAISPPKAKKKAAKKRAAQRRPPPTPAPPIEDGPAGPPLPGEEEESPEPPPEPDAAPAGESGPLEPRKAYAIRCREVLGDDDRYRQRMSLVVTEGRSASSAVFTPEDYKTAFVLLTDIEEGLYTLENLEGQEEPSSEGVIDAEVVEDPPDQLELGDVDLGELRKAAGLKVADVIRYAAGQGHAVGSVQDIEEDPAALADVVAWIKDQES